MVPRQRVRCFSISDTGMLGQILADLGHDPLLDVGVEGSPQLGERLRRGDDDKRLHFARPHQRFHGGGNAVGEAMLFDVVPVGRLDAAPEIGSGTLEGAAGRSVPCSWVGGFSSRKTRSVISWGSSVAGYCAGRAPCVRRRRRPGRCGEWRASACLAPSGRDAGASAKRRILVAVSDGSLEARQKRERVQKRVRAAFAYASGTFSARSASQTAALRVGGRAPVAARRERAAGRHLRPVGQRRALELVGEEADAGTPPASAGSRRGRRPAAARRECSAARRRSSTSRQACQRQERDLRRPEAVARQVVEVEVLQRVGADDLARWTGSPRRPSPAPAPARSRCRGWRAGSARRPRSNVARGRHEADQVLDQRLRHAGVDVVVRHLVADAVGAPAERQLGQVAGADHDAAVLVGEPEQVVGAQPGLHVLEGDVVDRLAAREGMAEVGEHLLRRRPDVDLRRRSRRAPASAPRRCSWCARWWRSRAGCRPRMFSRGRPSQSMARAATISACVESRPPETPMTARFDAGRLQPRGQALDLDVVGLVAILARAGRDRPARTGSARPRAGAGPASAGRVAARSAIVRKSAARSRFLAALSPKRVDAHALLADAAEVDVGGDEGRVAREALRLGEPVAAFVDRGMPVPGEVGGRFARPGGRVDVGRDGARRLAGAEQAARLRLADGDVAGRQVDEHSAPGQRRLGGRRQRHPEVLADLDVEGHADRSRRAEDQVDAERHLAARRLVSCRRRMPAPETKCRCS